MKGSYTIGQKIWFSLSILILGYLFSMLLGFFLGQKTESRLSNVAEIHFPSAQKSKMAVTGFKEQIRLYQDAVMMGETSLLDVADDKAKTVENLLQQIADIQKKNGMPNIDILEMLRLLKDFNLAAKPIYTQMSKHPDAMAEKALEFQHRTNTIQNHLEQLSTQYSDDLKDVLSKVRLISRQQRYLNLFIFIGVVICAVTLITFIIARSITGPLQKTLMLEKVAEQFADGIAVTGLDGKIIFLNKAWADIHGYTPDEVKDQRMDSFYTAAQMKDELAPFEDVVRQIGFNADEVGHKRKDDTLFPAFMTAAQMLDAKGRIFGWVYSVKDITHQKHNEEALRRAKLAAEEANVAKSLFLANMSHEIRTPLNGVMGVLNLLLATKLDNEQLDLVGIGKRSADSLLTVITDILDFSKIEAGKLDMETLNFDLRNTLEEVVELPALKAHEKGLEFTYVIDSAIPTLLKGDPGRLRQIILNLTNNAMKFTQKGEIFLKVRLENETETDAKLRFEVKDTGIGIAEDKCALVFRAFEQSDASTTRNYGGTGLGLSISKKLCELMHGEIGVESELGKGSTFWFTAVFEKQLQPREKMPDTPDSVRGKRFLLVDDNQTNLDILSGYLAAWGCFSDMARSGEVALSLLHAVAKVDAPYDAIIVDMLMPAMDGAELGKRIKNDPLLTETKMIMLTSMGMRGEAARMEKIGFAAYLTKPIRRSQFFDCLVTVFSQQPAKTSIKKQSLITKHSLSEEQRKKTRVLVVDDNLINQKLAKRMVEKFGFTADIASDGKEAVAALEKFKYNLVLMDVQMPIMDGFTATGIIRNPDSRVLDHDIPIIALTANAMKGDRDKCLEAGMNGYISKPIQPQELMTAIESYAKISGDSPHLPIDNPGIELG